MKTLNVGCGERVYKEYPPGYKCVNFDGRALSVVDVVGDVRSLPFEDEEFDFILASDILEHFPKSETLSLLSEWGRVLKNGGTIEFRVPDLETICKEHLRHKNAEHTSWLIMGAQNYETNYHYICFDREWLKRLVESAGFRETFYQVDGTNFIMKAIKL